MGGRRPRQLKLNEHDDLINALVAAPPGLKPGGGGGDGKLAYGSLLASGSSDGTVKVGVVPLSYCAPNP